MGLVVGGGGGPTCNGFGGGICVEVSTLTCKSSKLILVHDQSIGICEINGLEEIILT